MTRDQALDVFKQLCVPYATALRPELDQAEATIRYLMNRSYESVMADIDSAIRMSKYPPGIHELEAAKKEREEATRYAMPGSIHVHPYDIWMQTRIESLGELEYWQYIQDRMAGRDGIWEARWQHEYREGEPATAPERSA